jgi:hypothetical protein
MAAFGATATPPSQNITGHRITNGVCSPQVVATALIAVVQTYFVSQAVISP